MGIVKLNDKYYRHHSGYMTGLKEISYKDLMAKSSDKALTLAVKGMLPKNSLGKSMITKLKIYKRSEHNNQAQKPERCGYRWFSEPPEPAWHFLFSPSPL